MEHETEREPERLEAVPEKAKEDELADLPLWLHLSATELSRRKNIVECVHPGRPSPATFSISHVYLCYNAHHVYTLHCQSGLQFLQLCILVLLRYNNRLAVFHSHPGW